MTFWIIFKNFILKVLLQRHLIKNFVLRDLRSRYVGSFMGIFWAVIHPLVLLVSYTFVFSVILHVRPWRSAGIANFPVFLFSGILPWLLFQETVARSSTVILENANIIKKTLFPSEILPITVFLASLVNHAVGLAILVLVLALGFSKLSWLLLLLPLYLIPLMLFSLGLGWIVSCLNVFVRDTTQVLSVLLTFWFWFTPIFYSAEMVPEKLQLLMRLNPMTHVVNGYRDSLLAIRSPDWSSVVSLLAVSGVVFVLGGFFFRNTKREFADVL